MHILNLLVEKNKTLTLSVEEKMNYSRPSIDVLFETAADAYGKELIGVILTGASSDGSNGLLEIKNKGGLCIVQDPKTALMNIMPSEALKKVEADYVLSLEDIADALIHYKDLKCKG
jgi:two-component system chemotaxis response regulator CheB